MPRVYFKVGTKEYVGPTLRDILEKNKDLREQYGYEGYMGVLRYSGKVGGEFWFNTFFTLRFEEGYAKGLGHSNAKWYKEWKQENVGKTVAFGGHRDTLTSSKSITIAGPQPTPFFASGGSRSSIEKSYRVEVMAKGTRLTIRVVFRLGMIAFHGKDAFLKVPAAEYARVVQEVERTIRLKVLSQQETGGIDPRILGQDSRSKLESDLRPSFMKERAAI